MLQSALSRLFPPEITDMFIDNLFDDMRTLRRCSLVHSRWLPRSRFHLFKTLVIQGRKIGTTLVLYHTPRRLEKYISPTTRNLVKCLVLGDRFGVEGVEDDQVWIDEVIVWDFLRLLPHVDHLVLAARGLAHPQRPELFIPNQQERRRLKCLELSVLASPSLSDLCSLFSSIDTVCISYAEASVDDIGPDAMVPSFPQIRELYLLDQIEEDFISSLLYSSKPSGLASLEHLFFRSYHFEELMKFDTIVKEVGGWLPRLTIDISHEILDTLEGYEPDDAGIVLRSLEAQWPNLFTWDLCSALEELTIHCDICFSTEGDAELSPIVMPAVVGLLEDLAKSERVCMLSTTPLSLLLVLEIGEVVDTLVTYFRNTPWDRLKDALLNLHKHRNIGLGRFTIKLTGYHGVDLYERDSNVVGAISVLRQCIREMGLGFVDQPIVLSGSKRNHLPRWYQAEVDSDSNSDSDSDSDSESYSDLDSGEEELTLL